MARQEAQMFRMPGSTFETISRQNRDQTRKRVQARRSQHPDLLYRSTSIREASSSFRVANMQKPQQRSIFGWAMSKAKHGASAVLSYALDWVDDRKIRAPQEDVGLNDPSLDGISLHFSDDFRNCKFRSAHKIKNILFTSLTRKAFIGWRRSVISSSRGVMRRPPMQIRGSLARNDEQEFIKNELVQRLMAERSDKTRQDRERNQAADDLRQIESNISELRNQLGKARERLENSIKAGESTSNNVSTLRTEFTSNKATNQKRNDELAAQVAAIQKQLDALGKKADEKFKEYDAKLSAANKAAAEHNQKTDKRIDELTAHNQMLQSVFKRDLTALESRQKKDHDRVDALSKLTDWAKPSKNKGSKPSVQEKPPQNASPEEKKASDSQETKSDPNASGSGGSQASITSFANKKDGSGQ